MANTLPVMHNASNENITQVDVAAWTQNAIQAMNGLSLHSDPAKPTQGTAVGISIPLDDEHGKGTANGEGITAGQAVREGYVLRRKSSQRDSMRRRDALLKGKEGSRQRRRWENDRLIGNPHAEPPLPADWEVRPSYPVHAVPYYLAPLWDVKYAKESASRKEKIRVKTVKKRETEGGHCQVPKELKDKLKRSKGAKSLLQDLESEVRHFVASWEASQSGDRPSSRLDDSEDEEIVFVGRQGNMHDRPSTSGSDDFIEPEKLIFDALEGDQGAGFARWLVHNLGMYYGLDTWSVTTGNPARREAYVGIKGVKLKSGGAPARNGLPRPLYAMV